MDLTFAITVDSASEMTIGYIIVVSLPAAVLKVSRQYQPSNRHERRQGVGDVYSSGRKGFADIVLYRNWIEVISENEPCRFDHNGNGRIDFTDVLWLVSNVWERMNYIFHDLLGVHSVNSFRR